MANSKFRRGSGVFQCINCTRMTRDTNGDNGKAKMCEDCYEGSMQENGASDSADPELRAQYEADMHSFYQAAVNKGGVIQGYTRQ